MLRISTPSENFYHESVDCRISFRWEGRIAAEHATLSSFCSRHGGGVRVHARGRDVVTRERGLRSVHSVVSRW